MADVVISIVGGIVGGMIGGPAGAQYGMAIGAFVGSWLYPPTSAVGEGLPKIANLQITAAQKGQVLPVLYGKTRIPGTVIWYGAFTAHVDSGGGGKKAPSAPITITYTASLAIGLCEGQASAFTRLWANEDEVPLASFLYTFHPGLPVPAPDPYITAHLAPGQADLAYPYVSYLLLQDWNLGAYSTVPGFTFEVSRLSADVNACNPAMAALGMDTFVEDANGDMNPAYCLVDFMTDTRYGLGIPAAMMNAESFQVIAQWCQDNDLYCSPVLDQNQEGLAHIEHLLSYFDGILIFSEGYFKLRARHSPIYEDLGFAPVDWRQWLAYPKFSKTSIRQTPNVVRVEYRNRATSYNVAIAERKDDWDVGARGQYPNQISLPGLTNGGRADQIASKLLWSRVVSPFGVELLLGPEAAWNEPGDVLSVVGSDAYSLSDVRLRVINIREEKVGEYTVTAVEER